MATALSRTIAALKLIPVDSVRSDFLNYANAARAAAKAGDKKLLGDFLRSLVKMTFGLNGTIGAERAVSILSAIAQDSEALAISTRVTQLQPQLNRAYRMGTPRTPGRCVFQRNSACFHTREGCGGSAELTAGGTPGFAFRIHAPKVPR